MTSRKDKLVNAKTKLLEKFKRAAQGQRGTLGGRERHGAANHYNARRKAREGRARS